MIKSIQADQTKIICGSYNNNIYIFDFNVSKKKKDENIIFAVSNQSTDRNCTIS